LVTVNRRNRMRASKQHRKMKTRRGELEMTERAVLPWRRLSAAMAAVVLIVGIFVAAGLLAHKTVTGAAEANPVAVVQAAADNKAAADAAAAEQKKIDDAAALTRLEAEVRSDMQTYFTDPANISGDHITVTAVSLVNTAPNTFEGMAKMSANGGAEHDVKVHVTADDRKLMWSTDPGGLLPLFQ
jgi:hypothetical protein